MRCLLLHVLGLNKRCLSTTKLFKCTSSVRLLATTASNIFHNVKLLMSDIECQHDKPVNIQVSGLNANQSVTLSSKLKDSKNNDFCAVAHYNANNSGCIDVGTAKSIGGHYVGVFPMGLFSCLLPAPHENRFLRLFKRDVENPSNYNVSVYDGLLSAEQLYQQDSNLQPLASLNHKRHFMAAGVKKHSIKHGRVRGALFLPEGSGPFPGVIDMFGSAGGLLEYRAAQLASRGIATLALAFFDYDDLPKSLSQFDLDYFKEAVEILLSHDQVLKEHVGVVGTSKGGDLAIAIGTFLPEVTAVVCINGCISSVEASFKVDEDYIIEPLKFVPEKIKILENNTIDCSESLEDPLLNPDTIIPIERSNANFLFIVSGDDKSMNCEYYAKLAVDKLDAVGKKDMCEVLYYAKAGHLIEPPYSPFCSASYHKVFKINFLWGGEAKDHSIAQEQSWEAMIKFLKKNLIPEAKSKL